ncbi:nuclear transport factor 2 family protein [Terrimonas pollutisoli]|uniref:nuclear transport factor 2 family protein n=1 Tax=Terrimonas pollutisoli TaxID=3034147 RepID=UPI0023ED3B71|nr:nuclear transport factor 2 family protein [Terrimonas sp. H1YJ31]
MKPKSFNLILFLLAAMVLAGLRTNAQSGQHTVGNQELYQEIAKQDSLLFNAFNTRDIDLFKTMFTEDLEFYHDKGGLTGYEHTINFLKTIAQSNNQLKRELVKGSLEVYPIPGYGAMEIGLHRFCHLENGKQDCGTFKFVHIWQKKDNHWKITRVISYDH